jgi:hypothetical protein
MMDWFNTKPNVIIYYKRVCTGMDCNDFEREESAKSFNKKPPSFSDQRLLIKKLYNIFSAGIANGNAVINLNDIVRVSYQRFHQVLLWLFYFRK